MIELPQNGDVIGESDDANPSMDGIQITRRGRDRGARC
jgi:hypothetical protein